MKLDKLELGLEKIIEFSSFEEGVIHISRDQIFNIFRPPTPSVIKHDLTPSPTMIMINFFSLKNRHFNVKMEIFFDFDQFFRFWNLFRFWPIFSILIIFFEFDQCFRFWSFFQFDQFFRSWSIFIINYSQILAKNIRGTIRKSHYKSLIFNVKNKHTKLENSNSIKLDIFETR